MLEETSFAEMESTDIELSYDNGRTDDVNGLDRMGFVDNVVSPKKLKRISKSDKPSKRVKTGRKPRKNDESTISPSDVQDSDEETPSACLKEAGIENETSAYLNDTFNIINMNMESFGNSSLEEPLFKIGAKFDHHFIFHNPKRTKAQQDLSILKNKTIDVDLLAHNYSDSERLIYTERVGKNIFLTKKQYETLILMCEYTNNKSGLLLTMPPGSGKTFMSLAYAHALGRKKIIYITGDSGYLSANEAIQKCKGDVTVLTFNNLKCPNKDADTIILLGCLLKTIQGKTVNYRATDRWKELTENALIVMDDFENVKFGDELFDVLYQLTSNRSNNSNLLLTHAFPIKSIWLAILMNIIYLNADFGLLDIMKSMKNNSLNKIKEPATGTLWYSILTNAEESFPDEIQAIKMEDENMNLSTSKGLFSYIEKIIEIYINRHSVVVIDPPMIVGTQSCRTLCWTNDPYCKTITDVFTDNGTNLAIRNSNFLYACRSMIPSLCRVIEKDENKRIIIIVDMSSSKTVNLILQHLKMKHTIFLFSSLMNRPNLHAELNGFMTTKKPSILLLDIKRAISLNLNSEESTSVYIISNPSLRLQAIDQFKGRAVRMGEMGNVLVNVVFFSKELYESQMKKYKLDSQHDKTGRLKQIFNFLKEGKNQDFEYVESSSFIFPKINNQTIIDSLMDKYEAISNRTGTLRNRKEKVDEECEN